MPARRTRTRLLRAGTCAVLALGVLASAPPAQPNAPVGTVVEFSVDRPDEPGVALDIAAGADGNLWFSDGGGIVRVTTTGAALTRWVIGGNNPFTLAPGPDGAMWFEGWYGWPGRVTTDGEVTFVGVGEMESMQTHGIAAGPDGAMWLAEQDRDRIGRLTMTGDVTWFTAGITPGAGPSRLAAGPDGNVWFTEPDLDRVARITPAGIVTEFATGITPGAGPIEITGGPDGNVWFTEPGLDRVARITPAGTVTEFITGISAGARPTGIAAGPDGNVWFTEPDLDRVARITPAGTVTEFATGISAGAHPAQITAGPDGDMWFTEPGVKSLGRIETGYVFPLQRPHPPGKPVASAGDGQVAVAVPPSATGDPADSVTVVTVQDPARTCTAPATAPACTVTGLTNGTTYTFVGTATNAAGTSDPGPASDPVTPTAFARERQRPVAALRLPRRLHDAGWTRLLRLPVLTNAGQRATVTVLGRPLARASGRGTGTIRVSRSKHVLRVWLSGRQRTRVVLRVRAPGTDSYAAMRITRTYRTRAVR